MVARALGQALTGGARAGVSGRGSRDHLDASEPLRRCAAEDDGGLPRLRRQRSHRAPSSAIDRSGQENSVVDEAALQPLGHFAHQTPGTSFAPVLYGVVRVSPDPADPRLPEFTNVVATGANFGALRGLNPGWSATGQAVPEDLPPGTCAVGANLAARLHVHPGDSLQLHPRRRDGRGSHLAIRQLSNCDCRHHGRFGRRPGLSSPRRIAILLGIAWQGHPRGAQHSRRNP